jgi:hypothetical protein
MTERALTALGAFRLPYWDGNDFGVEVVDAWLEVKRGRASAGVRSRMWIGSHGLARWYQRNRERTDEHLLRDVAVGAAADPSDREIFPDLNDARVASIPCRAGAAP